MNDVKVTVEESVATVTLARSAKRNALTSEMILECQEALEQAMADKDVRGIIVTGEGPVFSAGVDISEFSRLTPELAMTFIRLLKGLCETVRQGAKPVVCAIQGHCVGGALEFALACDLRVATGDAKFVMPEVQIGLPSVIDAALFVPYIGLGRTKELLLTGDPMTADEALQYGLINRLTDADNMLTEARALLSRVTRHHETTIKLQKELFEVWLNKGLDASIDYSVETFGAAFEEGVPQKFSRRWLEKRN